MQVLPSINIKEKIHFLRNTEVMLDSDLAELYGVETKRINEAVIRNPDKFPDDFMFECTQKEWEILRSQFATLNVLAHGQHRKYLPKAFTEQGVYMLATILKSQTATEVTISIMRTFATMRWNTPIYQHKFLRYAKKLPKTNNGQRIGCLRLPMRSSCSKSHSMS